MSYARRTIVVVVVVVVVVFIVISPERISKPNFCSPHYFLIRNILMIFG